jgi:CRP/FNR family cyclic AMP-dependent transcriptional regulator
VDTTLLRNIPIFSAVSDDDLFELAELLATRDYAPGQPIVFLGDSGADMFIVQSGRVVVSYPDDSGKEVAIEEMGPGTFFGEISLLDGGPRTANVRAVTAVQVLSLQRDDFVQFMLQRPSVAVHILTVLGSRQRGLLEKLRGIRNVNEADSAELTVTQRRLSRVAGLFASERFLLANLLVITAWVVLNLVLRASGWPTFDEPPTFFWLGFLISVEAIVVTIFVLNAQRRQAERDRLHADLEYQVNVKAHMEVMELQRKVDRLLEAAEQDSMLRAFAPRTESSPQASAGST